MYPSRQRYTSPLLPFGLDGAVKLQFLVDFLIVDALGAAGGGSGALLLELGAHDSMELLLEDGFRLDSLELGLEVLQLKRRRVATAARIVQVVREVFNLVTVTAPIAFSSAVLFSLVWILTRMTRLGEVAREVLLRFSSAVSKAGVIAVSEAVGSSHGCLSIEVG